MPKAIVKCRYCNSENVEIIARGTESILYKCKACKMEFTKLKIKEGEKPKTIDPEELLEDLDFMVETVRKNCGIVSFLSVAHSAREIRQIILETLPTRPIL